MFNGIERLTCLQTLPHFVVSKDQNCLLEQLEGLHNLRGEVKLYGLNDVANRQEASKAKLCTKSNIESLLLDWGNDKDGRVDDIEGVIEGLKPHTNLKELMIEYFMGKRLGSWITEMTHLVKIRLSHCERCEEFPSLGHLPKLREMELEDMDNVRIIGSNCGAAGKVTTMYPSLTRLILCDMRKLEEWVEGDTSRVGGDQSSVQVFPKLEVLEIRWCSKLTRMPDSSFPSLKRLEGEDIGPISKDLLKNNPHSLSHLDLYGCRGLTRLTVGVALEELKVRGCPDLTSINAVKEGGCLRNLDIRRCPSLSEFDQSAISTIKRLDTDEIPGAFSSSGISFPNLTHLRLEEFGNSVKSTMEFDDGHVSALSALTHLYIHNIRGLKALPDTIAKLPSLEELHIRGCYELESLPTFDPSHSIRQLTIWYCNNLKERCKESGPEWYKIQHIPIIKEGFIIRPRRDKPF